MTNKTPNSEQEREAAIVRALELRPEPVVPADFAARVMQSLPAQIVARPRRRVGRTVALVAAIVLSLALFVIAPHAQPSFASLTFDIEMLLLAQLGAIGYWLAARREV